MYVLINEDSMTVLAKHDNPSALMQLAWIERPGNSVSAIPTEGAFDLYTFAELIRLYVNSTGASVSTWSRPHLEALLTDTFNRLPLTDINVDELNAQAELIPMDSEDEYRYVKGSKVPQKVEGGLFPSAPLRAAPSQVQAPATPAQRAPSGATGPDRSVWGVTTQKAPSAAPAPRSTGNSKSIIWEVADRMWADAGKPTDVNAVLALRRKMMDELLLKHDVKKTTSSTSLGQWQKVRLNT